MNVNYVTLRRNTPQVFLPFLDRIEDSSAGMRLARGMFWSVIGAVPPRALSLVGSIITAQILGKKVFGEWGMVQSTVNMFATFATVGVGLTATKHVAELRKKDPERAGRIIALSGVVAMLSGLVAGLLMVGTSSWLSSRLLAAPHLNTTIAITAIALAFYVVNEALLGTLNGLEAFRRGSAIQVVASVGSFPITVLGVYFFGLTGAAVGYIVSTALITFLSFWGIRREAAAARVPIRWKELRREIRLLTSFSLPTVCCGAVYVPFMWVVNALMVNTPNGYAEMGLFSAADRWRSAIMFLPTLLGGVTLPMLSSLRSEAGYYKVLWTNMMLGALAAFVIAAPVAVLSPWIMAGFGTGFGEGKWVLVTLCVCSVAQAAYWIVSQSLVSRSRLWAMFSFNTAWAALLVTAGWLGRSQGAKGLALAYLTAETGRLIGAFIYTKRMQAVEG